jgi:hypothetical protein
MTTTMCADEWREIARKAQREAAEWRQNFTALQMALVGDTGASGITVAAALRKDAERYRWLRANINGERWDVLFDECGRNPLDMEQLDGAVDSEMARAPAVGAA